MVETGGPLEADPKRLLLSAKLVTQADLDQAKGHQAKNGGSLVRALRALGLLDERRWAQLLAKSLGLPVVDLTHAKIDLSARVKAPEAMLRSVLALPYAWENGRRFMRVAMAEPQDDVGRAALRAAVGCDLALSVATYADLERALGMPVLPKVTADASAGAALPAEATEGDFDLQELTSSQILGIPEPDPDQDLVSGLILIDGDTADDVAVLSGSPSAAELEQRLRALQDQAVQNGKTLRAALELCLERGLFTGPELRSRLTPGAPPAASPPSRPPASGPPPLPRSQAKKS